MRQGKHRKDKENDTMKFEKDVVIGLEIHVELNTKTKLFCSCPTQGSDAPNSRTCPVCLGMPGSRPVLNKEAVHKSMMLAKALGCRIADKLVFSRKSYFYPDLAKNYQITQYEKPLGEKGKLDIDGARIEITRVHMEEDPASLIHPGGMSGSGYVLVDYNRSGNPLCEVVTEPQLESPRQAREFMDAFETLLLYLGIFEPGKNIIKADANVSVKETGYVRAEVKNISSFKEIERALSYEIERQRRSAKEGLVLHQETRAWNPEKGFTTGLRTKETEEDYGYIFDPDLVPVELSSFENIELPELPSDKAGKYKAKGVAAEDAKVITQDFHLSRFFDKVIDSDPALAARWVRRELVRAMNYNNLLSSELKIDPSELKRLILMIKEGKITEKTGQKIMDKLILERFDVARYVKDNDLGASGDNSELELFCRQAVEENQAAVSDYMSGKEIALNFLLGAVMKKSRGKADPKQIKEMLLAHLK
ncbi:MAG: Asp-tRNA(Asn)/Glu-tRNA(Gln) amidotransferase subunit GatB [Nanoarchaeota archaeon]|nr:Asp-tRNA(Asn)/Glu-tRNA(Gln) amidotransferase subunit GatB [Nanoarchaeota archaeon]